MLLSTLDIYQKHHQICIDTEGTIENGMQFLQTLDKIDLICGGIQDNQQMMIDFHQPWKLKNYLQNFGHLEQK